MIGQYHVTWHLIKFTVEPTTCSMALTTVLPLGYITQACLRLHRAGLAGYGYITQACLRLHRAGLAGYGYITQACLRLHRAGLAGYGYQGLKWDGMGRYGIPLSQSLSHHNTVCERRKERLGNVPFCIWLEV